MKYFGIALFVVGLLALLATATGYFDFCFQGSDICSSSMPATAPSVASIAIQAVIMISGVLAFFISLMRDQIIEQLK